jgi:hypothetical protein
LSLACDIAGIPMRFALKNLSEPTRLYIPSATYFVDYHPNGQGRQSRA